LLRPTVAAPRLRSLDKQGRDHEQR
jgi:hypothetical protein